MFEMCKRKKNLLILLVIVQALISVAGCGSPPSPGDSGATRSDALYNYEQDDTLARFGDDHVLLYQEYARLLDQSQEWTASGHERMEIEVLRREAEQLIEEEGEEPAPDRT